MHTQIMPSLLLLLASWIPERRDEEQCNYSLVSDCRVIDNILSQKQTPEALLVIITL
jgi:hypothetical protein